MEIAGVMTLPGAILGRGQFQIGSQLSAEMERGCSQRGNKRSEALEELKVNEVGARVSSGLRIDGSFDGTAADYPSIKGERGLGRDGIVETAVKEGSKAGMGIAGPAGVAKCALLVGASTQIPKILRSAERKRVDVSSN